jgi:SNF2 family DNA or RNA helicase
MDINNLPDTRNAELFIYGYNKLNDYQKNIITECVNKKSCGLSLPMGSGKTITSLVLSLYMTMKNMDSILIVCSKTLIDVWEKEINKFYNKELKYKIVHQDYCDLARWKLKKKYSVIITTSDVLKKVYSDNAINTKFIDIQFINSNRGAFVNNYRRPNYPYMKDTISVGLFYSLIWGCLIIDEAQMYTNIKTQKCQALGALCVKNRWLLSGTLFDEPKPERILGYYIMLNDPNYPRTLPAIKNLLKDDFKGLNCTLVHRDKNDAFNEPIINEQIITHKLTQEEEIIYLMMKTILIEVKKKAIEAKLLNQTEAFKKFNSYKLVMLMYLRQSVLCPLIPITSIMLNASDVKKKSKLSEVILNELKNLHLNNYLKDKNNIKSTRIKYILKCLKKHEHEQVIIFTCFVSFIDIMEYILTNETKRELFIMTSTMSLTKRAKLIENFKESKDGILLLTYELGANGLNLQFTSTVILADQWWNSGKTKQAIARINRTGQVSKTVNIYILSSNTGVENIILVKQNAKANILNELTTGKQITKIPKININEIIKLIELKDNKQLINKIYFLLFI